MKKKIWISFMLLLMELFIYILISPSYAASSSKCAVLTIYAYGDTGVSSLKNSGHTWITIRNTSAKEIKFLSYSIKPGETISVSKWDESVYGKGGAYINREQLKCGGTQPTAYSIKITSAQVKKIAKATPAESTYNAIWYNCTTYSTNMWNLVADKEHQISDGILLSADIPGSVAGKIASWDGARQVSYKGDSRMHWTDVYFISQSGKLKCVDSINISSKSVSLGVDSRKKLTASFKYSEELNKKIKWKSDNKKRAVVNSKGEVIGRGVGSTIITAQYGGIRAKCKVKVVAAALPVSKVKNLLINRLNKIGSGFVIPGTINVISPNVIRALKEYYAHEDDEGDYDEYFGLTDKSEKKAFNYLKGGELPIKLIRATKTDEVVFVIDLVYGEGAGTIGLAYVNKRTGETEIVKMNSVPFHMSLVKSLIQNLPSKTKLW